MSVLIFALKDSLSLARWHVLLTLFGSLQFMRAMYLFTSSRVPAYALILKIDKQTPLADLTQKYSPRNFESKPEAFSLISKLQFKSGLPPHIP